MGGALVITGWASGPGELSLSPPPASVIKDRTGLGFFAGDNVHAA